MHATQAFAKHRIRKTNVPYNLRCNRDETCDNEDIREDVQDCDRATSHLIHPLSKGFLSIIDL